MKILKLNIESILNQIARPLSRPLHKQIHLFIEWKRIRHPLKARSLEYELNELFRSVRVNSISQLTERMVVSYFSGLNGEWRKDNARNALKQFLTYWYKMGLLEREFTNIVNKDKLGEMRTELHPLAHAEQVERVHKLREQGLPFRAIKVQMETEDLRKYDVHQLHRWATYPLSTPPVDKV